MLREGHIKSVSVGYQVLSMEMVAKDNKTGIATYRCRWMPYEVSTEPIPADYKVGFGRTRAEARAGGHRSGHVHDRGTRDGRRTRHECRSRNPARRGHPGRPGHRVPGQAGGGSAGTRARRDPRPRGRGRRDHGDGPGPRRGRQGRRVDPPGAHPRPGLPRDPEARSAPRAPASPRPSPWPPCPPGTGSATPSTGRSGCRPRSWTGSGAATTASRPRSTRSWPSTGPAPTTAGSWSPGGSGARTSWATRRPAPSAPPSRPAGRRWSASRSCPT